MNGCFPRRHWAVAAAVVVAGILPLGCANTRASEGAGGGPNVEPGGPGADVTAVRVTDGPGGYAFSVTIESPDTGCDRYADWWEAVTPEGELVYRRILMHSHVDEQPFTRSGGPVVVESSARVIVRAHMNDSGYGGVAFAGSVDSGFSPDPTRTAAFAPELADEPPLPNGCAF